MKCSRCHGEVVYGEGIEVSFNPVIRHYDGNCGNCGAVQWHAELPLAPGSQGFKPIAPMGAQVLCPISCLHHRS